MTTSLPRVDLGGGVPVDDRKPERWVFPLLNGYRGLGTEECRSSLCLRRLSTGEVSPDGTCDVDFDLRTKKNWVL